MKKISCVVAIGLVLSSAFCSAASVIILDEGINTDKKWDSESVVDIFQVCSSLGTIFSVGAAGQPVTYDYLSLCENENPIQRDERAASQYQDRKTYTSGGGADEFQVFGKDKFDRTRGDHGNTVSNALYSFDNTITQRPIQVFGIEFDQDDKRHWRNSYINSSATYDQQQELPGWNIIRMLKYISEDSASPDSNNFDQLTDLGAINISVVLRGPFADRLCADDEGQDYVNSLRNKGIAVVAGVDNEDYPVTKKSWPACLDHVIGAGGLTSPGLGIGANNFNYFAKDTQKSDNNFIQTGNSFAAPRVAAAFALLHERYPSSTLGQKHSALIAANSTRERITSQGSVRRAFIKQGKMDKAIEELGKLLPPEPLVIPDELYDETIAGSYGPIFGGSQATTSFVINIPIAATSVKPTSGAATEKIVTSLKGKPRDVMIDFNGAIHASGGSFLVRVNGVDRFQFTGFPSTGEADARFVIHRRYLNNGNNQIEIRPINAGTSWGVRNIRARYLPIVPLTLGATDSNEYGYNGNPSYLSGMRASFELSNIPSGGIELSMDAWDIDHSNETSILVNGRYVGRLSTTQNNSYGSKDTFIVSTAKLRQGTNYIELIQRDIDSSWFGAEDEKWAVKNLSVKSLTDTNINDDFGIGGADGVSALAAIISMLLLLED